MTQFTPEMEKEYDHLMAEADQVIYDHSGATQRLYTRALWTSRTLFLTDPHWVDRSTFTLTLRDTWIMSAVSDIVQRYQCQEWLEDQRDNDDFTHPDKTETRMAELASISALSRIMFTSTVEAEWIPNTVKAYWYVLAWEPLSREEPHQEATVLSTGHHVSVFPF